MAVQPSLTLSDPPAQVARWSAAALIGLLAGVALLIAWRRLAGALSYSLPPAALVAAGAAMAAAAAAARLGLRAGPNDEPRPASPRRELAAGLLLSAALLLLGSTLCLPGSGGGGMIVFWAILAGEEGWAWRSLLVARRRKNSCDAAGPALLHDRRNSSITKSIAVDADAVPAENVLQQLTLSQQADGGQQLAGWLRVRMAAGQRSCAVHVAFCPPFSLTPELALEQLDGPAARIRTAQVLPYGVRLEVKLAAAAASPASVLLRFSARATEHG